MQRQLIHQQFCVRCSRQEPETQLTALLHNCSFAKEDWWRVLSWLNCTCMLIAKMTSTQDWWANLSRLQATTKRKVLHTTFVLTAWHLWRHHNARRFRQQSSPASQACS
ncbi:hypothetical protein SETIT_1G171600v2 [Setaria italica]|uniref:Reverse transcriptase zinc-binding domain-containing protein n=1 Tax=Setaria italica TaxID=4555 RepID=A0A368PNG5_SETIT|nr:hypothetical protein SETIT_1G171600v2 [Setaria italica]